MKTITCNATDCPNEARYLLVNWEEDGNGVTPACAWVTCAPCMREDACEWHLVKVRLPNGTDVDYTTSPYVAELMREDPCFHPITTLPLDGRIHQCCSLQGIAHTDISTLSAPFKCEIHQYMSELSDRDGGMNFTMLAEIYANYIYDYGVTTWGPPGWTSLPEIREACNACPKRLLAARTQLAPDQHDPLRIWRTSSICGDQLFELNRAPSDFILDWMAHSFEPAGQSEELEKRFQDAIQTASADGGITDAPMSWRFRKYGYPRADQDCGEWLHKDDSDVLWLAREYVSAYRCWEFKIRRAMLEAGFDEDTANHGYRALTHLFLNYSDHDVFDSYDDDVLRSWLHKYLELMSL